jgi:hypothetical protein
MARLVLVLLLLPPALSGSAYQGKEGIRFWEIHVYCSSHMELVSGTTVMVR